MIAQVTILKAKSQPYKDKTTGEDKFYNEVSVMYKDELVEMSTSKEIADKIIANFDIYKNKTLDVDLIPRGFELADLDPVK